jgi:hypothetical protein
VGAAGLPGIGHNTDGDAAGAGPQEGVGELPGGEVEDGEVDRSGRLVDLVEERGSDPALGGEVDLGCGVGGERDGRSECEEKPQHGRLAWHLARVYRLGATPVSFSRHHGRGGR